MDTRAEPQSESGDSLLAEVQTEDDLDRGGSRTNARKRWVGLKIGLLGEGCHNFIIKRLGIKSVKSHRGSDYINAGVEDPP